MSRGKNQSEIRHGQLAAVEALKSAYAVKKSWRAVGAVYGLNAGLCCAVAKNQKPAPPAMLVALKIAPGKVEIKRCPDCGEVHTVGWCVKQHGEPQMPKPRRAREVSQYIDRWTGAHLRHAITNREVMA